MSEQWLGFLGRFHPVLVHLPIGLVALLGFLELLARSRRFRPANTGSGYVLALAVPTALGSALTGWLLAAAGGYEGQTLQWHRWSGVATTILVCVCAALYRMNLRKAYRATLLLLLVTLGLAGHNGGTLTHGAGYLLEYAPAWMQRLLGHQGEPASAAVSPEAEAYSALIQPVLNQYCIGCHGPDKSKGGLRMETYAALMKGGSDGPVVLTGKAADSRLVQRIHLPPEDEDHMPPDGKPQPALEEIRLLEWWINNGASEREKIKNLPQTPEVAAALKRLGAASAPAETAAPVGPPPAAFYLVANNLGVAASALGEKEPWVQVNASVAGTNFNDAALAQLRPFADRLRWLDLAGTAVTDAGIKHLAAMRHLTRLQLQRTAITDAALADLGGLPELEYLNLYGTPVTDEGLAALKALPQLRQLYLWQTRVSTTAATAFAESRIDHQQIRAWETEIEALQARIRAQHVRVDVGQALTNAPGTAVTNNPPVAALACPVSGKPAKPDITVQHEGGTVAFCCEDCKAAFLKEPAKYTKK